MYIILKFIIFCCFHKALNRTSLGSIGSCCQAEWITPDFRHDFCAPRWLVRWKLFVLQNMKSSEIWHPSSFQSYLSPVPPYTPWNKHTATQSSPIGHAIWSLYTFAHIATPTSSKIPLQSHPHLPVKYFHSFLDLIQATNQGIPYEVFFWLK